MCPAMYNTEYIIQHTLQRRWSRLQHIAVFSFLGPHCTGAPAVRNRVCVCVCVSAFVYDVCGYVREHVGGRTWRDSKGLFTARVCASERAR